MIFICVTNIRSKSNWIFLMRFYFWFKNSIASIKSKTLITVYFHLDLRKLQVFEINLWPAFALLKVHHVQVLIYSSLCVRTQMRASCVQRWHNKDCDALILHDSKSSLLYVRFLLSVCRPIHTWNYIHTSAYIIRARTYTYIYT